MSINLGTLQEYQKSKTEYLTLILKINTDML